MDDINVNKLEKGFSSMVPLVERLTWPMPVENGVAESSDSEYTDYVTLEEEFDDTQMEEDSSNSASPTENKLPLCVVVKVESHKPKFRRGALKSLSEEEKHQHKLARKRELARKYRANMTPEQLEARRKRMRENSALRRQKYRANMTPEPLEARRKQMRENSARRSQQWTKEEHGANKRRDRERLAKLRKQGTQTQREAKELPLCVVLKVESHEPESKRVNLKSLSEEEKRQHKLARKRELARKYRANMTPEQLEARRKRIRENSARRRSTIVKVESHKPESKRVNLKSLSEEEKHQHMLARKRKLARKYRANMTLEQLEARRKRMRENSARRRQQWTKEEHEANKRRDRERLAKLRKQGTQTQREAKGKTATAIRDKWAEAEKEAYRERHTREQREAIMRRLIEDMTPEEQMEMRKRWNEENLMRKRNKIRQRKESNQSLEDDVQSHEDESQTQGDKQQIPKDGKSLHDFFFQS